jgi:uncharacterized protein GlcG (DUF336 family)
MHTVPAATAADTLALVVATGAAFATNDAGGRPDSPPKEATIPLRLAAEAAAAAVEACEARGFLVSAAVVDPGGNLKALLRADGAGPHTTDSSFKKAYTSASLREPTGELAQIIVDLPQAQGLRDMNENILILGGGLPIEIGGEVVGGIGVGGAPGGDLDEACAEAGLRAIGAGG